MGSPAPPSMRAPTAYERLTNGLSGAFESLQNQPFIQLLSAIGEQMSPQMGDMTLKDPSGAGEVTYPGSSWSLGALPMQPGRISLPGSPAAGVRGPVRTGGVGQIDLPNPPPARTAPIPGSTLDDMLAAGEAQYPGARTIQQIEPGSGRAIDPAREAAIARARTLAGR